jgi:hypothetical protein
MTLGITFTDFGAERTINMKTSMFNRAIPMRMSFHGVFTLMNGDNN